MTLFQNCPEEWLTKALPDRGVGADLANAHYLSEEKQPSFCDLQLNPRLFTNTLSQLCQYGNYSNSGKKSSKPKL